MSASASRFRSHADALKPLQFFIVQSSLRVSEHSASRKKGGCQSSQFAIYAGLLPFM